MVTCDLINVLWYVSVEEGFPERDFSCISGFGFHRNSRTAKVVAIPALNTTRYMDSWTFFLAWADEPGPRSYEVVQGRLRGAGKSSQMGKQSGGCLGPHKATFVLFFFTFVL